MPYKKYSKFYVYLFARLRIVPKKLGFRLFAYPHSEFNRPLGSGWSALMRFESISIV